MASMIAERSIEMPDVLPWQREVIEHPARFKVPVIGRRGGKSFTGQYRCVEIALEGGRAWWVSPTYPMASVGWRELCTVARQIPGARIHRSDLSITMPSGGSVHVMSASDPDRLRGDGLDHVTLDEAAFMAEEAWTEALRPALADRRGTAWFTSTPSGYNWLHRLYVRGQDPEYPQWQSWQIPTWVANPMIPSEEIDEARRTMSAATFAQEFGAEFVAQEGRVYPEFARSIHVRTIDYVPGLDTSVGIDFGLRSFAFQLRQYDKRSGTLYVLADRIYRDMTTAQAIKQIQAEPFASRLQGPVVIGVDPAGSARNVQTKRPDVELIQEAWPLARVMYSTDPSHRDPEWRAARKRDLLMAADGSVRMYVDPSAKHTIDYLEQSVYPKHRSGQPEKTEPVKDGVVDHMRDADGYGDVALMHMTRTRFIAGSLL